MIEHKKHLFISMHLKRFNTLAVRCNKTSAKSLPVRSLTQEPNPSTKRWYLKSSRHDFYIIFMSE